jgi:hypothetical protein
MGEILARATNLRMELFGTEVDDFTPESESEFASITAEYAALFFEMRPDLNVEGLRTVISVTGVTPGGGTTTRGRGLQTSSIFVIYEQDVLYQSSDPSVTVEFLTTQPFAEEESRNEYTTLLAQSDDPALKEVESVSSVDFPTQAPVESPTRNPSRPLPTNEPEPDDGDGISTGAIIGIAVGGGAFLIGCLLYNFCSPSNVNLVEPQNEQLDTFVVKEAGDDEISTLGPPIGLMENVNRFGGGYENQR